MSPEPIRTASADRISIPRRVAYGVGARTIRSDADVMRGMGKAIETLGVYTVLVFFAAQFVAYFGWTNLGLIFAVEGADLLRTADLGVVPLMLLFVVLSPVLVAPFLAVVYRRYRYPAPGPTVLAVGTGLYACGLVAFTD